MSRDQSETIVFDRSAEPWVGRFDGVGSVHVWSDGRTEVDVESTSNLGEPLASIEEKRRALEFGWAEPLSLVRRGFSLVQGLAAHHPGKGTALVIGGDVHDVEVVAARLAQQGLMLMADRIVPLAVEEHQILVHPRMAPIITTHHQADRTGLPHRAVRDDSDAVAVEVGRHERPCELAGIAFLGTRRPQDMKLRPVSGHERFDLARKLLGTGALVQPTSTHEDSMRLTVRLASLPAVVMGPDHESPDSSLNELLSWWETL